MNKRAISPIIATILLFIVALVAVAGWLDFNNEYKESVKNELEDNANMDNYADTLDRIAKAIVNGTYNLSEMDKELVPIIPVGDNLLVFDESKNRVYVYNINFAYAGYYYELQDGVTVVVEDGVLG